jgi:outer membrane protein assembly factor BamA
LPLLSFKSVIYIYFLGFFALYFLPVQGKAQHDSLKTVPVEKLPLTIKSPANIRPILVLPIIARSIETGWSFGLASAATFHLKSRDTAIRTSNAQALALYTTRRQFVMALNSSIYFPGERFILNEQLSYSSFPDNFWGLGKHAPDTSKESYKFKQYYIYLHPQFLVGRNLFFGVLYEYQRVFSVDYKPDGLFDQQDVAGRYGYHVSGFGLSITYDTRNNAFAPDKGVMLQFSFDHFAPFFGSDYQYTNYVIDLRRFLRIYKQQVLALQIFGSFNAGETPLRSLSYLGGANLMRGYYAGRYRDKNAAVIQAEYRVPLFWRIAATGFADVGNVGPELDYINFHHFKYSYGGGLRVALNQKERLNLRLDYGIAKGSSQGFYLQLGEAF